MSVISAPARAAIANPSPVAIFGFVVFSKSCPHPPVHKTTVLALMYLIRLCFFSKKKAPAQVVLAFFVSVFKSMTI